MVVVEHRNSTSPVCLLFTPEAVSSGPRRWPPFSCCRRLRISTSSPGARLSCPVHPSTRPLMRLRCDLPPLGPDILTP